MIVVDADADAADELSEELFPDVAADIVAADATLQTTISSTVQSVRPSCPTFACAKSDPAASSRSELATLRFALGTTVLAFRSAFARHLVIVAFLCLG